MKFGGTSVEDAAAIKRVTAIVRRELPRAPLVVVSACAGVTNALEHIAELSAERQIAAGIREAVQLRARHVRTARELLGAKRAVKIERVLTGYAAEIETLVRGVGALGELTPRSRDAFLSYGERMSSLLLVHALRRSGIRATLADAAEFMITDGHYTKAAPLPAKVRTLLRKTVRPQLRAGRAVVTQGFLGMTEQGIPTTLGRGGSDFSASFVGAQLGAKEIQIWTDVDGILTAEPGLVREARNIPLLSFREASELAYFGARVLHPDTILPAVQKKIPVLVLNSRKPENAGTRVVAHRPPDRRQVVQSIAYKEGVTLLTIVSTRMFLAHGFLENVFDVFHKYRTVVHTVATSDVTITAAVDDVRHLDQLLRELRAFASVSVSNGKALICIVGEGLKHAPGTAARIITAVGDIDINMISAGASEINVTIAVDERAVPAAVRRLHREFFSHPDGGK